ncbi:MAG TPA: hypothetical protein VKE69_15125 [Planctomycetota bacterium]|nr:hypothetical protein [Planctomycetota bacterium]
MARDVDPYESERRHPVDRALHVDEKVTEDRRQHERNLFGFCCADSFRPEDRDVAVPAATQPQATPEGALSPAAREAVERAVVAG